MKDCGLKAKLAIDSRSGNFTTAEYNMIVNCSRHLFMTKVRSSTPTSEMIIEEETLMVSHSSQDLVSILAPFIMVLGVIGNILLYFVFPKCTFAARLETRLYIRALAITDIVIMIGLLRKWLHALKNLDFATSSVEACKAINLISYVSTHFAVWLVVAITGERCQAVMWPRKPTANRYRRHVAVIVVLAILSVLLNIHHAIDTTVVFEVTDESGEPILYSWDQFHEAKPDPARTLAYCSMDRNNSNHFVFSLWTVIDGVAYSVVPSLLIIAMNIVIAIKLVRVTQLAKKSAMFTRPSVTVTGLNVNLTRSQADAAPTSQRESAATPTGFRNGSQQSDKVNCTLLEEEVSKLRVSEADSDTSNRIVTREREITVMLLIFSAAFVVLTAPYCVVTAISNMRFIFGCPLNATIGTCEEETEISFDDRTAAATWVTNVAEMLMYAQHACQFYLYLCGRNFRKLVSYALCTPPPPTSFEVNELAILSRRRRTTDYDDELLAQLGLALPAHKLKNSPLRCSTAQQDERSSSALKCLTGCYIYDQARRADMAPFPAAAFTHNSLTETATLADSAKTNLPFV